MKHLSVDDIMNAQEKARANKLDALFCRFLGDDLEILVSPMTFGKARLTIGNRDDVGFEDGYCYADPVLAILAALTWTGEGDPIDGWHRHLGTGRRRPDGDPSREKQHW